MTYEHSAAHDAGEPVRMAVVPLAIHLPARRASAPKMLNIRYVYELAQKSPSDLFQLPNFGKKSLRKAKDKLAILGLTLGMTLEDDTYRGAVVATVAANIHATKG